MIILDLDETLIHSTSKKLNEEEDFILEQYFVYKRPNLDWFLQEISKHFCIGIWSSADGIYVTNIAEKIIPNNLKLEIMWDKDWCDLTENKDDNSFFYEKRLEKLTNLNLELESLLLVDDSLENYQINKNNAYKIKPFNGDKNDNELEFLYKYLMQNTN